MVRQSEGSDPAAVVFDAITAGKARGSDVIICDTAGRLHNKKNLMDELSKISRVIQREDDGTITVLQEETCYSYGNAGSAADLMPAYGTSTVVERQMDLDAAHMAVAHGLREVVELEIFCAVAGVEGLHAEVDGVRAVADGGTQGVDRAGGREQFEHIQNS